MSRVTLGNKKRLTIEDLANFGCECLVCSSQDVIDNFDQVGRKGFARLALSALEARTQASNSIDKQGIIKVGGSNYDKKN